MKSIPMDKRKHKFFKELGFTLPISGTYYGWKIGDIFYEGDPSSKIVAWWPPYRAYLKNEHIVYVSKKRKNRR